MKTPCSYATFIRWAFGVVCYYFKEILCGHASSLFSSVLSNEISYLMHGQWSTQAMHRVGRPSTRHSRLRSHASRLFQSLPEDDARRGREGVFNGSYSRTSAFKKLFLIWISWWEFRHLRVWQAYFSLFNTSLLVYYSGSKMKCFCIPCVLFYNKFM